MEDIKIEKNIPLKSNGRYCNIPIDKMEVNDSIFIPKTIEETTRILHQRVGAAIRYYKLKKNLSIEFAIRSIDNGVRIWRIK